ncbi:hypothetical protein [Winogradskyella tangerina]|uniref:hypothetical protein n=1 Tax=Winogradskyella tangerina TaxID=2023240 RepID=UPI000DBE702C|nr:hypothetical protein [Winogradskyella tangerina]
MKQRLLIIFFVLFAINLTSAQAWMTNLEIAQRLALVQNKMVLMVWEETTSYEYPVLVKDKKGRTIFINNLFEDEYISPLIWEHFVPVIVSEDRYADLYEKIKGKRSQKYIDKFNDDTIKIMDVNGNIVNTDYLVEDFQNVTNIINQYAFDTSFLEEELNNYRKDKNFFSAYYLASKYLDIALYTGRKVRSNIVELSNIYLDEAKALVVEQEIKERDALRQRCELLKLQEFILLRRPKKAVRALKKIDEETIAESNKSFVAFLYYTAYMSMDKYDDAEPWKSKISSLNLKKAQKLINLNT